jgi:hypothetical protein
MDQELITYLDSHFRGLDQRLKDLRHEMNHRFERVGDRLGKLEEAGHLSQGSVEGLRDDIALVAEGIVRMTEGLEEARAQRRLREVELFLGPYYEHLERSMDVIAMIRERFGTKRAGSEP